MLGGLAASLATKNRSGYAPAATIVSGIYLLGFLGTYLVPETKGRPLPEDIDLEAGR